MQFGTWTIAILLVEFLTLLEALIDSGDLPSELRECFDFKTKYSNVTEVPSEDICITCVTDYLWKHGSHVHCFNKTEHDLTWVAQILTELYPVPTTRYKRTPPKQRRRRKEYRMLSDKERDMYHLAINRMKKDRTIKPNRYDAFVIFHSGMAGRSAHRGPNFMGWHRILLIMYEYSLDLMVPGVTLPYWDSTLDSAMSVNPVNSIIWGEKFMGNGNGQVVTGPFRHWFNIDGTPLIRNIGGGSGQLMTKRTVLNILSQRYNHQIIEPSRNPLTSLEGQHDLVHKWVGGKMFDVSTSPMDPIFFMHHAYVDCLWEIFRKQQIQYRINPEKDYPDTKDPLHKSTRQMDNLPPIPIIGRLRNIDGYKSFWTDKYYFYDPPPTCSLYKLDCGSKWLECDPKRKICVSKSRQTMTIQYPTYSTFNPYRWWMRRRGKRDTYNELEGDEEDSDFPTEMDYEKVMLEVPRESVLGSPIQNIYKIDCREDINAWAFMPVVVVQRRPPEIKLPAYIIEKGVVKESDMYDDRSISKKSLAKSDNCVEDESGAFRVNLVTYGITYGGWYEDYVVVDNRQKISSHIGYVAFRKPGQNDKEPTQVFITATDSCGRLCKARCLTRFEGNTMSYVPCSGVLQITNEYPLMYSNSLNEAMDSLWDYTDNSMPRSRESDVALKFYCDYSDSWPWDSLKK